MSLRTLQGIRKFLAAPVRSKYWAIAQRIQQRFPHAPIPLRLPFGAWWLAQNDDISEPLRHGSFETAETAFVAQFLQPGMTVLDIGANQGYYTLLAAQKVGKEGRVFSFEPSPRERKALLLHKKLNRSSNVTIASVALGAEEKETELFVVQGSQTGCNSLRPPVVFSGTEPVRVKVMRLDKWLKEQSIDHIDFIKLDVEGGELDVLKGADGLLERRLRPVILVEVQDIRTEPWGYKAKEIIEHLCRKGFQWFQLKENGSLEDLGLNLESFDGNFVAWPEELEGSLQKLRGSQASSTSNTVRP